MAKLKKSSGKTARRLIDGIGLNAECILYRSDRALCASAILMLVPETEIIHTLGELQLLVSVHTFPPCHVSSNLIADSSSTGLLIKYPWIISQP